MLLINNFKHLFVYFLAYYAVIVKESFYLHVISISTFKNNFKEVSLNFVVPSSTLMCHINSIVLYYAIHLLLISNDVHPNPGPRSCISYNDFLKSHSLNKDYTKYIHINFQIMKCKSLQFKDFLESTHDNNTIYGFTETWLTEDESRDQNCDVAQYADDTLLFTASTDLDEACRKLEQNYGQLVKYFNMHKMQVNVDKTDFIVFKPNRNQTLNDISLEVQSKTNERSLEIKYLGIFIDDKLNYDKQIKTIVKKMAMGIRGAQYDL